MHLFVKVLDACSAPGNKTVHIAALMRGKGRVIACELNKDRVRRLEDTIKRSGASSILCIFVILIVIISSIVELYLCTILLPSFWYYKWIMYGEC